MPSKGEWENELGNEYRVRGAIVSENGEEIIKSEVIILLAAYKGNQYIQAQIDSILFQDFDNWKLVLSDDGDYTEDILNEYAKRFPTKIIRYKAGRRFGSAKAHFMHLVETFKNAAPYIMLSDQDDVWNKDKIRKTLDVMKATEENYNGPILVHTDLRVVDSTLHEISPSFFEYSHLKKGRYKLNEILIQNVVSGCTLMMNGKLASLVSRGVNPNHLLMHDHWIALVAAFFGRIAFLDEPTLRYRQHEDNSCGVKPMISVEYILAAAKRLNYRALGVQAHSFFECYKTQIPAQEVPLIKAVFSLGHVGKIRRLLIYCQYGLWLSPLVRRLGQIVFW